MSLCRTHHTISIHPLRGEWDLTVFVVSVYGYDFNPPTPWGVGLFGAFIVLRSKPFQSTHSVGSGTFEFRRDSTKLYPFQSTHSVGSGTSKNGSPQPLTSISIHPLRGEWDHCAAARAKVRWISIHPLRGEWDIDTLDAFEYSFISIHPLRGEWDKASFSDTLTLSDFNPPTPWGVGRQPAWRPCLT